MASKGSNTILLMRPQLASPMAGYALGTSSSSKGPFVTAKADAEAMRAALLEQEQRKAEGKASPPSPVSIDESGEVEHFREGSPARTASLVSEDFSSSEAREARASDEEDEYSASRKPGEAAQETGRWSSAEHARFLDGLKLYGRRKWQKIAELVGTRTTIQVRSHAQKYFKKIRKESEAPQPAPRAKPAQPKPPPDSRSELIWLLAAADKSKADKQQHQQQQQHHHHREAAYYSVPQQQHSDMLRRRDRYYDPRRASPTNMLKRALTEPRAAPVDDVLLRRAPEQPQHRDAVDHVARRASYDDDQTVVVAPRPSTGDLRKRRRTLDDLCAVASLMLSDDPPPAARPSISRATLETLDSPAATLRRDDPPPLVPRYAFDDRKPFASPAPAFYPAGHGSVQPLPRELKLPVPYRTKPFVHNG